MKKELDKGVVLIRGGGELATGVGWTLAKVGYRVIMTEVPQPLMVRWPVCFGTAVPEVAWEVEQMQSVLVNSPMEWERAWRKGEVPVLVDPKLKRLKEIGPTVVVDAILAKRNLGTLKGMAALTIGLGPGFCAGEDVDLVIETNRGHNLGRLIYSGRAEPNTGIPGEIGGVGADRVVYSHKPGVFRARRDIGDYVVSGEIIGEIVRGEGNYKAIVTAPISGVLRGILRTGTDVEERVKLADIDPRGCKEYCVTISDKARAIGGAVLRAIQEFE